MISDNVKSWLSKYNLHLEPVDEYKISRLLIDFQNQVQEKERNRIEEARIDYLYGY